MRNLQHFSKDLLDSDEIKSDGSNLSKKLMKVMDLDSGNLSQDDKENILRNFIFTFNCIKMDMKEIDERIKNLSKLAQITAKDDTYKLRKNEYFKTLNIKAKEEIVKFFCSELYNYLLKEKNVDFTKRSKDKLWTLFFNSRYEYSTHKKYYDIDYDFSTESKIRYLPNLNLIDIIPTVRKYIELRSSSSEKYNDEIQSIIDKNDLVTVLFDKVKNYYVLQKREEIFSTLVDLFKENKYQSFISLAVIQLEGVFYDYCLIKSGANNDKNMGTLVEKAQKIFSENHNLWLSVYPYFAFEVPELRNEIAHNGMLVNKDLKITANEIALDLNTAISLIYSMSLDKYKIILLTWEVLNESITESSDIKIESTLLCELFSWFNVVGSEFLTVLKDPDEYQDEIDFYQPIEIDVDKTYLPQAVGHIEKIIKTDLFWNEMLSQISRITFHAKGKPYDFIDFAIKMKNIFIPVLTKDSPEKEKCKHVAAALHKFESRQ